MNDLESELEKKYLRAQRFKTIKELEKEYSKELITLYKEKVDQTKREEEFKRVVELYKTKIEEIEYLKNKKQEIIENAKKNELEKDKSNLILQEYLNEVERKKSEFEKFMKDKGKEALKFVKKNKEIKQKLDEELYKYENKRKTKQEMNTVAKITVDNFREKKEKEKLENQFDNTNNMHSQNVIYKINQTFHNMGSKIDYSTTRFHNIVVVKHEDELNVGDFVPAQEKAMKESEKLKEIKKSKEVSLKVFDNETKMNSKEIIRKQKAKENLQRLNEELGKIHDARKKSKSKNKMLTTENMKAQAKQMEKKSHYLMNTLLKEKMSKRTKVFNTRNKEEVINACNAANDSNNISLPPDDLSEFYRDEEFEPNQNDNPTEDGDDYLNKAILEHNQIIEHKNINNNKTNFYEEPLIREPDVKEEIRRLNPVDLESYTSYVTNPKDTFKTIHKNSQIVKKDNLIPTSKNEFSIKDLVSKYKPNAEVDQSLKQKASSLVMEFFSDVNKTTPKEKSYLYVEPKLNLKDNKENLNTNSSNKTKVPQTKNEPIKAADVINVKTNYNTNTNTKANANSIKNANANANTILDAPLEPEENVNAFERDETKWKYSKQELLERKKKLLKDKSNIKKNKK